MRVVIFLMTSFGIRLQEISQSMPAYMQVRSHPLNKSGNDS